MQLKYFIIHFSRYISFGVIPSFIAKIKKLEKKGRRKGTCNGCNYMKHIPDRYNERVLHTKFSTLCSSSSLPNFVFIGMHTFLKMLLSKFLVCDIYVYGVCICVTHRYILLSAFYSLSTNRMLHRISFKSLITLKYMRYEKVGMKSTQKQRKYMCVLIFRVRSQMNMY